MTPSRQNSHGAHVEFVHAITSPVAGGAQAVGNLLACVVRLDGEAFEVQGPGLTAAIQAPFDGAAVRGREPAPGEAQRLLRCVAGNVAVHGCLSRFHGLPCAPHSCRGWRRDGSSAGGAVCAPAPRCARPLRGTLPGRRPAAAGPVPGVGSWSPRR